MSKTKFPSRNSSKAIEILNKFKNGSANSKNTIESLQKLYLPTNLNQKYIKEKLDKIQNNQLSVEDGERELHFLIRLEREYIPRNSLNNTSPKKASSKNGTNKRTANDKKTTDNAKKKTANKVSDQKKGNNKTKVSVTKSGNNKRNNRGNNKNKV